MSGQKHRQSFARKLRGLFRSEDWQHTPHVFASCPNVPTIATVTQVPASSHAQALCPCSIIADSRLIKTTSSPDDITTDAPSREKMSTYGHSTLSLNVDKLSTYAEINRPDNLSLDSPTSLLTSYNGNRLGKQDISGDRKRTEERYNAAIALLKETLRLRPTSWNTLKPPEFDDLLEGQDLSNLRDAIEKRLNSKDSSVNPTVGAKLRKLMEQVFVVLSPFATNLLVIAKEGQAVCHRS